MRGATAAVVLYAADIDVTRQFYETVGLAFVEERHDEGPVHYACDFQGIVLEIYPLKPGASAKPCTTVALIFQIDGFDGALEGLKAMGMKPGAVTVYAEGRGLRAVSVRDPEGLLVRLFERDPHDVQ